MSAQRKQPDNNNPFAAAARFHLEEALAAGARVILIVWEGNNGMELATVPQSKAVARGLLASADDALFPDAHPDTDDD
mgnify:CR=1 FL=1